MKRYQLKIPLNLRLKNRIWHIKMNLFPHSKRLLDMAISSAALILLSPLLLLVMILVRAESKGSAIFKQKRIGLNGEPFTMLKFRSMSNNAESLRSQLECGNEMNNGVLFKIKKDPRITRVGAIIRKTSIDELPQLINVLRGDMSLVGPRPPLPSEVSLYSNSERVRLSVMPGITCLWQIAGRSDIPFEQQVKLDVDYIERQSLSLDLIILIKTIPAVITARGAY